MKAASRPQYYRIKRIVDMVREGSAEGYLSSRSDFRRELELSPRTLARDLDFLRDEERAPIEYDARAHGYRLTDETYRLPPVRLSRKEAFSFALVRKLLAVFEGTPLDMDMRSVLAKIAESLEGEISVEPEWLGEHVSVLAEDRYRWTPPSGRRPRAFWSAARPSGPITRPSRARCRLTSWAPCTCWPTSGFEILEVNALKITRMSKAERVALKGSADEAGLGLTYSIVITADMDLASENAATRKKGASFLQDLSQAMKSMVALLWPGSTTARGRASYVRAKTKKSLLSVQCKASKKQSNLRRTATFSFASRS